MTRVAIAARQVAGTSGITRIVLENARRLSAAGWDVHLFAETLDPQRVRDCGGVPHRVPVWPWGRHLKRRFYAWAAARAVARAGCDLVWGQGDLLEQDVLSLHNCVHAAHEAVHGRPLPDDSAVGRLHARVLGERRFRLLLANSELMRREVVRRFGVPEDRVRVAYPGYDPQRFRPQDRGALGGDLRRRLEVADDGVRVGLVSSGDFAKRGVETFLRALRMLDAGARGRVRGVVVGHDSRWRPPSELGSMAGGRDGVRILPPVPDVERVYHALDILAHPAPYEEFGLTVLEAMACGVPVVTSTRVGAAELLRAEAPELVLDAPEPEALRHALARLVEDPDARRRSSEGSVRAARGHTWDDHFAATRACLESLLPAPQPPGTPGLGVRGPARSPRLNARRAGIPPRPSPPPWAPRSAPAGPPARARAPGPSSPR